MLESGYAEAVPCILIRAYCQTKMENGCWNSADNIQTDNPSIFPQSYISLQYHIVHPFHHFPPSILGWKSFVSGGLGGLWRRPAAAKNGMKIMLLRIRLLSPLENLRYNTISKIFTRTVFFFVTPLRLPTDDQ